MPKHRVLSKDEVEAIRTIGRDEKGRRSSIGLVELDGLCDSHEALRDLLADAFETSVKTQCGAYRQDGAYYWVCGLPRGHEGQHHSVLRLGQARRESRWD